MKTINEPRKIIDSIWRHPQPILTVYRPIKFLLITESEDGLLLYNLVTSELVLLDNDETELFNSLPEVYNHKMDELISRHFLVKDDYNENKAVLELRALLKKLNTSKRVNGFTILPTTECNARCFYCFESDHKHCTMTKSQADDVIKYIVLKSKGERVEICWFGGEPLVAKDRITQICSGLRKNNLEFGSSMVSNAYLFNEDLIQTAKTEWNLTNVQITLDGTETVYNESKAYVNPKDNPYKRVLRNIGMLLDSDISVNVRLNVTDSNINDLFDLVDVLEHLYGGKRKFSSYAHAVYEDVGFKPLSYNDETKIMIDTQTVALGIKLREKGLLASAARLPELRYLNCMADNDSCRLIYPDGLVGKCENRSSFDAVGDIYNDITKEDMNNEYKVNIQIKDCEDCALFPNCINLKLCPETGECSTIKRDWKINRYITLIKRVYYKSKQKESENCSNHNLLAECEV